MKGKNEINPKMFELSASQAVGLHQNELRQENGSQKAMKCEDASVCNSITYEDNGRKGKKGNGVSSETQSLEEFPVHVFPSWIRDFIEEHNEIRGFPKDYTSAGVMAALSLACGNNRYIERPYISKPVIWIALVGKPGAMKTHPLNAALEPFKEADEQMYQEYRQEKRRYESQPERSRSGDEPKLKQLTVNDTTMEALVRVLDSNPSGVLLQKDELAGWIKEMDRYRQGGGDMENWNSIFSLQQIRVNRASGNNLFVSDPYVSIVGTVQPRILKNLSPDGAMIDNGFLDRMLFVYPENERKDWVLDRTRASTAQLYKENIRKILDQREQEQIFEISEESIRMLKEWDQQLVSRFDGADELEEGLVGKLRTYASRFMILLHIAHNHENAPDMISEETTRKAIHLLEYFEYQVRKVRTLFTGKNPLSSLTEQQRQFFQTLPDEFKTQLAQEVGQNQFNISERNIGNILKRFRELGVLKKVMQGSYCKT